jgi:coenzyme F420-0:L-glutamate ligase / coenzyme F420-1:gamma-L-glutamate ligase
MDVRAIHTPIISPEIGLRQDLLPLLDAALLAGGVAPLLEHDVLCITSKVVAVSQGRVVDLATIEPSPQAREMKRLRYSKDFAAHPELAELVLREADLLFAGAEAHVYLTLKGTVWIANAGLDLSNAHEGTAILWPEAPWAWVAEFRRRLLAYYGVAALGVLLTDSRLTPLRRGVTGVAIAYAGFEGIQSEVGKPDLFGRPLKVTQKAVADDLAATAVLVSGEAAEGRPFTLIRGAPVIFTDREIDPQETFVKPQDDLYAGIYSAAFKSLL